MASSRATFFLFACSVVWWRFYTKAGFPSCCACLPQLGLETSSFTSKKVHLPSYLSKEHPWDSLWLACGMGSGMCWLAEASKGALLDKAGGQLWAGMSIRTSRRSQGWLLELWPEQQKGCRPTDWDGECCGRSRLVSIMPYLRYQTSNWWYQVGSRTYEHRVQGRGLG